MNATVTIVPYGSLCRNLAFSQGQCRDQPLAGTRCLAEILTAIGLPAEEVQLAMVNHRPATADTLVSAGDRIALFPVEYPIFADWHAYRRPVKI